ncbi:MAG: o-succinylbenzoate---CoA ligase [Frankiaceae bacterium]|jgi:O-succinylbenzoic acid--CoA ligase|nr:o-succinylbenzoate---CoA ligase [Frankiaceae bacterium]
MEAAWAAGDAVLPLDPALPTDVRRRVEAELRPDLPVDGDVALVIATSGSTGVPKGVELSAAALEASARATAERIGLAADDVWLSCLPWHHIAGLQVWLRARLLGSGLRVQPRFDVVGFAAAAGDATVTSLVPTQLRRLLDAGADLARFRVILLGGGKPPPGLVERAQEAGANVVTTYGMSETCGGCVYDGKPLRGVGVRVDGDGRVWLRGPVLASGYRLRPDLTAEALVDGWLRTADRGRIAPDGDLVVFGRLDDVVVSGGENVDPAAVAAVLATHPSVDDVAVVGVPDDEWGQAVAAVVVLADGASLTVADARAWCADRLPVAALPRHVIEVDAMPMLASGKPDRAAIRQLAYTAAAGTARSRQSPPPSVR